MKIIGGESELLKTKFYEYFTDSGRSSIRLILESFRKKKFLIPNYLCEIIIKIFEEYKINYSFYKIRSDLSIDRESLKKEYDIIYIINYFGQNHKINDLVESNKIVIEDNVFCPIFINNNDFTNWIGFNSFRKISPLADGSIIKSTLPLLERKIKNKTPEFSKLKYDAKDIKYNFINNHQFSENDYLNLFRQAEENLNIQKSIYNISSHSLFRLFEFMSVVVEEYKIRQKNYNLLFEKLNDKAIKLKTNYPSFFVLSVEKRDDLRKYLFSKKIFCPIHWPSIDKVKCHINDKCLSIPVDSRYSSEDMMQIIKHVNHFFEK